MDYGRARSPELKKQALGTGRFTLCVLDSCQWLAPWGLIHPMVDLAQVTTFVIGPYDTDT